MKYRIALVQYLNTWPISKGISQLQLDDKFEFHRVIPSACATLFAEGKVDISLCPVGALSDMPPHEVRGAYCIGADGPVETVVLLSKVPLEEITSVKLDHHSRTSNLLVRLLAEQHWRTSCDFYFEDAGEMAESCLMIGDKVFEYQKVYAYQYDLAEAWKAMTGLPMVFAVWIARPGIPEEVIQDLDRACAEGLSILKAGDSGLSDWQASYLTEKISYPLDAGKQEAMKLFQTLTATIDVLPVQV